MSAPSPACSVVIPARDCLAFLPAALASVDAQGCDVEIIVVDDASQDGTSDWLAARRPDVIRLSGEGRGPAHARNSALAAARAPLIAVLDADDLWRPGKLARQLAAHAAHPAATFSFADYLHVDPDGGQHGTAYEFWSFAAPQADYAPLPCAEAFLLGTNIVGASTVTARRDALLRAGGFAEDLPSAEDWDLWLRLAAAGDVLVGAQTTMTYLMRPGGETRKRAARIAAMERILSRYEGRNEFASALALARGRLCAAQAEWARERGAPGAALAWRMRAFRRLGEGRLLRAAAADALALSRLAFQQGAPAAR
jgi:glycosyltransferase involved in cell wall biosynthesis